MVLVKIIFTFYSIEWRGTGRGDQAGSIIDNENEGEGITMFENNHLRRLVLVIAALIVLPPAFGLAAVDPINKNLFGTALDGYDAVAYYKESRPVKGKT